MQNLEPRRSGLIALMVVLSGIVLGIAGVYAWHMVVTP